MNIPPDGEKHLEIQLLFHPGFYFAEQLIFLCLDLVLCFEELLSFIIPSFLQFLDRPLCSYFLLQFKELSSFSLP